MLSVSVICYENEALEKKHDNKIQKHHQTSEDMQVTQITILTPPPPDCSIRIKHKNYGFWYSVIDILIMTA